MFPYYFYLFIKNERSLKNHETCFKFPKGKYNPSLITNFKTYLFPELITYKQLNKKLGISFNDLIMSLLISAMKNLTIENNLPGKEASERTLVCPISTKSLPNNMEDIDFTIEAHAPLMNVPFISDPLKESKLISMKNQLILRSYGLKIVHGAILWLLTAILPYHILIDLYRKGLRDTDFTISNVPGPKKALVYSQNECLDIIPYITKGLHYSFFPVFTYANKLRIAFAIDANLILDPEQCINYFLKSLKKLQSEIKD